MKKSSDSVPYLSVLIAILTLMFLPNSVHADGSKSGGMGTAFIAVADDPSAISGNPAGLTQDRGTIAYAGSSVITFGTSFKDETGQKEKADFQVFAMPHLFIVSDLGLRDARFGVGVYSSFGIGGRKWDKHGPLRYLSVESYIGTLSFSPTVAYQIAPYMSFGAGLNVLYSQAKSVSMVNQDSFADGEISMEGDGIGYGYNLGVLVKPLDEVSIGIAYRNHIKVKHEGRLEFRGIALPLQPSFGGPSYRTDAHVSTRFPSVLTLGLAYRPTNRITFSLDLEQTLWSSFDKAEVIVEDDVPEAGLVSYSTPLDWKDVWAVKTGLEYKATDKLSLRAGYFFIPAPVPGHTLEPGNPDADTHNISLGFGYIFTRTFIDFYYTGSIYKDRNVNNPIQKGKYSNSAHMAGLSMGYRF
jgi:long-chain fatty acid transport protein